MHIYYNFRYTETQENKCRALYVNFYYGLTCSIVRYEPELELEPHQNFRPEKEPHKVDAAQQHWYNG
jgi:hypothetical protein